MFNLENIKDILENDYELLLFYDTREEKKLVDVVPDIPDQPKDEEESKDEDIIGDESDIDEFSLENEVEEEKREYEVQTITKTKVYSLPFTIPTDDPSAIFLRIKSTDLPKIIIEKICLCKNKKELISFSNKTINGLNNSIKSSKPYEKIDILIAKYD